MLAVGANAFIVEIFTRFADLAALSPEDTIDSFIPFIATGLISILVLVQVPHIAAGLAGGISLSSYGAGRLGLSLISRAAKAGTQAMMSGTSRTTRYAARKVNEHYRAFHGRNAIMKGKP